MDKWCIRVWCPELERYVYMTMVWISHGSVNFTSDTTIDFVSYDTQEQAQAIIDGYKQGKNDIPFWNSAEPFEYTPLNLGGEFKRKAKPPR